MTPNSACRTTIAAIIAATAMALMVVGGGCQPATETVTRQGQSHYRHNGLHFQLLLPDGWTARTLDSDLALEMLPSRSSGQASPAVHVFSRRGVSENMQQLADDIIQRLDSRADINASAPAQTPPSPATPADPADPADPASPETSQTDPRTMTQQATLAGLPATLITRQVMQGPELISQQIYLLKRRSQIWALIISLPDDRQQQWSSQTNAIRDSFQVW